MHPRVGPYAFFGQFQRYLAKTAPWQATGSPLVQHQGKRSRQAGALRRPAGAGLSINRNPPMLLLHSQPNPVVKPPSSRFWWLARKMTQWHFGFRGRKVAEQIRNFAMSPLMQRPPWAVAPTASFTTNQQYRSPLCRWPKPGLPAWHTGPRPEHL